MNFTECDISGHLKAEGSKGQYWIIDNSWTYLERVTPTQSGALVERLGTFDSATDAMAEADRLEAV